MQELSDNDLLSAYIDGELELSAREELQQRLNSELELRRQYKALVKANEHFCESVDEIDHEYLPKELVSLLESPKDSSDIGVWSPWSKALAAAVFIFAIVPISYVYLNNLGNTLEQQLQTVLSTQQSGELIEDQEQNTKFYINFSFVTMPENFVESLIIIMTSILSKQYDATGITPGRLRQRLMRPGCYKTKRICQRT
jgi:hypothetical protein